jgi:hypothetical protein
MFLQLTLIRHIPGFCNYGDEVRRGQRAHGLQITAPGRNHCKYELAINLKIAKLLGLDVPPTCRLAFAPYGREPRLLVARNSRRAVVVSHLEEPGSSNVIAPGVEIEQAAIAAIAKAFLVVTSWV